MAGENVVSIVVKASDQTKAGFDEAKAGAGEAGAGMDGYAAAVDRVTKAEAELLDAQIRETDAQLHLAEVQASDGGASADVLAAAQDKVTAATLRSLDAQIKLTQAEAQVAVAERGAGDAAEEQGVKADTSGGLMAGAGGKMKMAALGVAVGLGLAVKGAADFQQQTVKLVTSAGESAKNLGMVQQGILGLSSATNTSTEQLASGMYMVESAGFHGANGLKVLKAAAEGAQAEGADLSEVANAVTSGLNAYGLSANHATSFTNEMVAAVGQGKMTMQDLASSLSAVLPIAASAHISFAQVGGAIATMTSQGMSARQASQDLAASIRGLLNPNQVAVNEMSQFGISSLDVANKLGQRGLTGTISYLADAIAKQLGPSGDVILRTFNQSKAAAQDAETMLSALPPKVQALAKSYLDGTTSYNTWNTALKALPPILRSQAQEFGNVADKAHGFNDLLKSGQPGAQTFAAALGKMMGGATGLNTALMLTGSHTATFNANVKAVGDAAGHAGNDVKGWSDIQHEANFQIGSAEKAVKAMGDSLGLALLPAVTAILHPLTSFFELIASNKAASIAFAVVVGGVLAGALGSKLAGAFKGVKAGIEGFGSLLEKVIPSLMGTAAAEDAAGAAGDEMGAGMTVALGPIGLIIAAIAVLVAGFAYLWTHVKGFRDFWIDVWKILKAAFDLWLDDFKMQVHVIASVVDAVREAFVGMGHGIEAVFDAIVGFIKEHWKLLLAIMLPGLGLVVDAVATHWKAIEDGTKEAWDAVTGFVSGAVGAIGRFLQPFFSWIESTTRDALQAAEDVWHVVWGAIRTFVQDEVTGIKAELHWFAELGSLFRGWWDDAVNAVRTEIDKLVGWVEKIPGRINSALGGLPGMMLRAGMHVIDSLIDGMLSKIGDLGSAVGGIAKKVAGFFGLSPAVEGPLSGGGAPEIRGAHFAEALAQGMAGGRSAVQAAAQHLAGAAAITPSAGAYGGTGAGGAACELAIQFQLGSGGSGIDQLFMTWLKQAIRTGGGDPRILTKKVAFL